MLFSKVWAGLIEENPVGTADNPTTELQNLYLHLVPFILFFNGPTPKS